MVKLRVTKGLYRFPCIYCECSQDISAPNVQEAKTQAIDERWSTMGGPGNGWLCADCGNWYTRAYLNFCSFPWLSKQEVWQRSDALLKETMPKVSDKAHV